MFVPEILKCSIKKCLLSIQCMVVTIVTKENFRNLIVTCVSSVGETKNVAELISRNKYNTNRIHVSVALKLSLKRKAII